VSEVLVLYYSETGALAEMARHVARGVERVPGMQARLRTVPPVSATSEKLEDEIPAQGPPYASEADLHECTGLVLGSPTHFGNMAAALKYFWDRSSSLWFGGQLAGKPAGVFTASASPHGGQEATLLSMIIPLLHHGMLIVGLPFSESALMQTDGGGSPYGAGHQSSRSGTRPITEQERLLCAALGERIADIAARLET
jgi:NAD(P)H dehydrogenase (quinone)